MTIIGLFGDSHSCWDDLDCVINQAIKHFNIDMAIQVGDFGYYPQTFAKFDKLKFKVPVYALTGNHDCGIFIAKSIKNGDVDLWREKHNIHYVPQASVMEFDGCSFGFLGKAYHVDRKQEGSTKHRTTNYILHVELEEAIKNFNDHGKLDFIITHSCPHSIGVGMVGNTVFLESIYKYVENPFGVSLGPIDDCGEPLLTKLWYSLKEQCPEWVFGHHHSHYQKKVENTTFTCVGSVDSYGGKYTLPYIIDTKKKTMECFPDQPLLNSKGFHSTRLRLLEKNDYPI